MKQLIIVMVMLIITMFTMVLPTSADDVLVEDPDPIEEVTDAETDAVEETETDVTVPASEIDYDKIASDIYDKIKDELPQGLAENIVKLINSWDETDKEGATFGDRVKEFFEPDNLVNTVSIIFMVIVGIIIYWMKMKQGISIKSTNDDLVTLKKQIDEQIKDGKAVGGGVNDLSNALGEITKYLDYLDKKIDERQDSSDKAREAAIGVATMLKNIFQNSKTIDAAGKKIMTIDYLKAIGESIEEIVGEDNKEEENKKDEE